jgi:hypothetical protein
MTRWHIALLTAVCATVVAANPQAEPHRYIALLVLFGAILCVHEIRTDADEEDSE